MHGRFRFKNKVCDICKDRINGSVNIALNYEELELNLKPAILLPMKTALDLWSNIIIAMELRSLHTPSLLEPFLTVMGCMEMVTPWQ